MSIQNSHGNVTFLRRHAISFAIASIVIVNLGIFITPPIGTTFTSMLSCIAYSMLAIPGGFWYQLDPIEYQDVDVAHSLIATLCETEDVYDPRERYVEHLHQDLFNDIDFDDSSDGMNINNSDVSILNNTDVMHHTDLEISVGLGSNDENFCF